MQPTLLIADDDPDVLELLCRRCEAIGLTVDTASNAMTALGKAEEMLPDAVLLDVEMPYGNGLSVCEMMAGHEELASTPVIVMTGAERQETVRRCHQLCAYYVPKGPDLWARIEPVLRDLLPVGAEPDTPPPATAAPTPPEVQVGAGERGSLAAEALGLINQVAAAETPSANAESQPWALSIDDDEDVTRSLTLRIGELGYQVHRAAEGRDGYRTAFVEAPSLIILDYELPEGNGDYVLRRLKESPATAAIPVIVLTGRRDVTVERQMRGLGADDFFHKPVDWEQLRAAVLRLAPEGATHAVAQV